jgi:hypothetical protein
MLCMYKRFGNHGVDVEDIYETTRYFWPCRIRGKNNASFQIYVISRALEKKHVVLPTGAKTYKKPPPLG